MRRYLNFSLAFMIVAGLLLASCGDNSPTAAQSTANITTNVPVSTTTKTALVESTSLPAESPTNSTPAFLTRGTANSGSVRMVYKLTGGSEPFNTPVSLTVDSQDNLYVYDPLNGYIYKFDQEGKLLAKWGGGVGGGDGQFRYIAAPAYTVLDAQNNLYVVDPGNQRIQKFDANGKFVLKWGSKGLENGQFLQPGGITIDRQGNLLVSDFSDHTIQKFDSNGKYLSRWSSTDNSIIHASMSQITVDAQGNFYIPKVSECEILKYDPNGKLLAKWGAIGKEDGQFASIIGLAVDSKGNVYAADYDRQRIQKFDPNGKFLLKWGTKGRGEGEFLGPGSLALDSKGYLYVADANGGNVQKFQVTG